MTHQGDKFMGYTELLLIVYTTTPCAALIQTLNTHNKYTIVCQIRIYFHLRLLESRCLK